MINFHGDDAKGIGHWISGELDVKGINVAQPVGLSECQT